MWNAIAIPAVLVSVFVEAVKRRPVIAGQLIAIVTSRPVFVGPAVPVNALVKADGL